MNQSILGEQRRAAFQRAAQTGRLRNRVPIFHIAADGVAGGVSTMMIWKDCGGLRGDVRARHFAGIGAQLTVGHCRPGFLSLPQFGSKQVAGQSAA